MLVYQTLDTFDEKAKIKSVQEKKVGTIDPTYLGLVMENFIETYELNIYGHITNTNYKYVIIKNETKTNALGQKPSETPIKNLFKVMIRLHTEVMLNPFFQKFDAKDQDSDEEIEDGETSSKVKEHQIYMESLQLRIDEQAKYYEKSM